MGDFYRKFFPLIVEKSKIKRAMITSTASYKAPEDKFSLKWWVGVATIKWFAGSAYSEINAMSRAVIEGLPLESVEWTLFRCVDLLSVLQFWGMADAMLGMQTTTSHRWGGQAGAGGLRREWEGLHASDSEKHEYLDSERDRGEEVGRQGAGHIEFGVDLKSCVQLIIHAPYAPSEAAAFPLSLPHSNLTSPVQSLSPSSSPPSPPP